MGGKLADRGRGRFQRSAERAGQPGFGIVCSGYPLRIFSDYSFVSFVAPRAHFYSGAPL